MARTTVRTTVRTRTGKELISIILHRARSPALGRYNQRVSFSARQAVHCALITGFVSLAATTGAQIQTAARIVEINGNHRNGTATFRIETSQSRDVRLQLGSLNLADAKPMV